MGNVLVGVILVVLAVPLNAAVESPYKGQQIRDIKALSQADIEGYLNGKGMGLAKAAELNHYPGPKHVMELTKRLGLTETQIKKTQNIFNSMQFEAIKLGKKIVIKEQELDLLFAERAISTETLDIILLEIGSLQAKLRYVHLSTHLKQKQLLTKHQVMLYDRLRGYGLGSQGVHSHSH